MMKRIFFLIGTTLLLTACQEDDNTYLDVDKQAVIRYATVSPWCNRCGSVTDYTPQHIAYATLESDQSTTLTCEVTMPDSLWLTLINSVSLRAFNTLPESIGCPGCADGLVEWIEIETSTSSHRVTFEGNEPPTALSDLYQVVTQADSAWCGH